MDSHSAAHALNQVAMLLELHGEARATVQDFQLAARQITSLTADALALLVVDASPDATGDPGPATLIEIPASALPTLKELLETNSSSLLETLQEKNTGRFAGNVVGARTGPGKNPLDSRRPACRNAAGIGARST